MKCELFSFPNECADMLSGRSSERIPNPPLKKSSQSILPSSKSTLASSKSTPASSKPTQVVNDTIFVANQIKTRNFWNQRSMKQKAVQHRQASTEIDVEEPLEIFKVPRRGPIIRPHTTPVEKTAEKFEIAKTPAEPPESDPLDDSGFQHELHLRNSSPGTEKSQQGSRKRNPSENFYRPIRDLAKKSAELPEGNSLNDSLRNSIGLARGSIRTREDARWATRKRPVNDSLSSQETSSEPSSKQKTEQQVKTQVHHPRLSITEKPIRVPRRSLNKALNRDQRPLKIDNQSSTVEVTRKNLLPDKRPYRQYPPSGIAAVVQSERQVGNERRQRNGYYGTTQVVHHQCSSKSRVFQTQNYLTP
ncbi:hypothetical protein NHQ30_006351 [Ciborinia camelliae]|nr:hypothetical protein NHQ30_006351 [Ciborinia camelliae]